MKKGILKSALLLSLGGVFCKIIGAVYKISLANILGAEGMGVYQLSYPIYAFLLVFVSGGIPYALSSSIAKARAKNNHHTIMTYFYYSVAYSLFLAILFFLIMFAFGKQLALIQGNENAGISYLALAITILFSCLLPCFRGLFQGYENYIPTFFSQIIEQTTKLLFGLLFSYILIKQSLALGVFGAMLGILCGEVLSFIYLFFTFLLCRKKYEFVNIVDKKLGMDFLKYSITFSLTGLVVPFLTVYQSFISIPLLNYYGLSKTLSTTLYGIQTGMVSSIINFPTVLSTSLATVLMPSISYFYEINKEKTKKIMSNSIKIIFIFAIPCMVGIYILSPIIMKSIFPNLTESLLLVGSQLLKLSSLNIFYLVIAQVSIIALQSIKLQKKAFVHMLIFAFVQVISLPIFIINIGVYGFIYANILSYSILCILNIHLLKKYFYFKLEIKELLFPFIASFIMGIFTYFSYIFLKNFNNFINIFITVLISALVYFFTLFIFKVISIKEIKKYIFKGN